MIESGKVKALIDPFISGNPLCHTDPAELTGISHVFVTHGHGDHVGDTRQIAKANNSMIVTVFELAEMLAKEGFTVNSMHIGGRSSFEFGSVKMTPALHGGGVFNGEFFVSGGNPCGFLIDINGKKVYHAGDTGLTMDMQLLADENVDVALVPIGGKYTMDIADAVRSIGFIKPKLVIPMHYNTFPVIEADPEEFKKKVIGTEVKIMSVGESFEI